MYKSVCVDLDCLKLSQCVNTRGNKFKIVKESAKLDIRKYIFALRTFDMWNVLSNDTVGCKNSHLLNNKLRNIDFTKFLTGRQLNE